MTEEEKRKIGEQQKQDMQVALQRGQQEQPEPVQQSGNNSQSADGGDNPYGLSSGFMESWRKYSNNKNRTTQELIQALRDSDPYTPKTKYDEDKEAKRRKREGIIAAIGDGISALANLYGTTQGALNSYDPRNSLSAALRRRWDRIDNKERDRKNNHVNTLMKINELQNAADDEEIGWRKYFETARQKREAQKAAKEAADKKAIDDKTERDRNFNFKVQTQKENAEEKKRHNGVVEAQNDAKIGISRQREGRLSNGRGSSSTKKGKTFTPEHTKAAWDEWWRYSDEQRKEWRKTFGNRKNTKDDDNFVNAVKQMHDDWLGRRGLGQKKPSPTGGNGGKKKSPTM